MISITDRTDHNRITQCMHADEEGNTPNKKKKRSEDKNVTDTNSIHPVKCMSTDSALTRMHSMVDLYGFDLDDRAGRKNHDENDPPTM